MVMTVWSDSEIHMLLTVDAYVVSELNSRLHWGLLLSFQLRMTANAIRENISWHHKLAMTPMMIFNIKQKKQNYENKRPKSRTKGPTEVRTTFLTKHIAPIKDYEV